MLYYICYINTYIYIILYMLYMLYILYILHTLEIRHNSQHYSLPSIFFCQPLLEKMKVIASSVE